MAEKKYIVTITRQFGSLGRPIAREMSEILGIEYYDRDIVEETSKKMLFVVVGLSIGVPALARMIWKIWFLLAIFLIGENALNGLNIMLDKMADLDFIANLSAFFISIIEVHKAKEVKIQNVFKIMAIVAIVIIGSAIYRIFV